MQNIIVVSIDIHWSQILILYKYRYRCLLTPLLYHLSCQKLTLKINQENQQNEKRLLRIVTQCHEKMGRGGGFQPTKRDTVSHEIWGMGDPKNRSVWSNQQKVRRRQKWNWKQNDGGREGTSVPASLTWKSTLPRFTPSPIHVNTLVLWVA